MILLNILDVKDTMSHLLLKDSFDEFYLEDAYILTYAGLSVSGKRNRNWYDSDEEKMTELIRWCEIKKVVFEYIKGKKTPAVMKISLKADENIINNFLADTGCYEKVKEYRPDLYMQIRYEKESLKMVTGISFKEFIMDKTIENAWDEAVKKWIKSLGITCELV